MSEPERVSLVLSEWLAHRDEITPEEMLARHPAIAEELRRNFVSLGVLDAAPAASPAVPPGAGAPAGDASGEAPDAHATAALPRGVLPGRGPPSARRPATEGAGPTAPSGPESPRPDSPEPEPSKPAPPEPAPPAPEPSRPTPPRLARPKPRPPKPEPPKPMPPAPRPVPTPPPPQSPPKAPPSTPAPSAPAPPTRGPTSSRSAAPARARPSPLALVGRHPLVAVAVLVLAAAGAGAFWWMRRSSREADAARRARYEAAIEAAELPRASGPDAWPEAGLRPLETLAEAKVVDPARPEAFLLAALIPGRDATARQEDLAAAVKRGAGPATAAVVEAEIGGQDAPGAVSSAIPDDAAAAAWVEGVALAGRGELADATARLDAAVEAAKGAGVATFARRLRASIRLGSGDLDGAADDLASLTAAGAGADVQVASAWIDHERGKDDAERRFDALLAGAKAEGSADALLRLAAACRQAGARAWHAKTTEAALAAGRRTAALLVARASDDPGAAGDLADEALRLEPKLHAARELRAMASGRAGRVADEIEALEAGLGERPDCPACLARLAWARTRVGPLAEAEPPARRALELDPGAVDPALALARSLLLRGAPGEARAVLEACAKRRPHDARVAAAQGDALRGLGRTQEASAAYERALALEPHLAVAAAGLGRLAERAGAWEDAERRYAEAIAADPTDAACHVARWRVLVRLGRTDERKSALDVAASAADPRVRGHALEALGRLDDASAAYADAEKALGPTAEVLEDRARVATSLGREDDALPLLERAALLAPVRASVEEEIGRAHAAKGEAAPALAAFEKALSLDPDRAAAHAGRARLRLAADDPTGAMADAEAAVRLAPDDAEFRLDHARALVQTGDTKGAETEAREAVRLSPRLVAGLVLVSDLVRRRDGPREEALDLLDRALRAAPDDFGANRRRGEVLFEAGRFADATQSLDRAIASQDDAAVRALRGRALFELKRFDLVATDLEKALLAEPKDARSLDLYARSLVALGRDADALPIWRRLDEVRPDDAHVLDGLGGALVRLGRYDDAVPVLERATGLDGEVRDAWYDLGLARSRTKQPKAAAEALEHAVAIDADHLPSWLEMARAYQATGDDENALRAYERVLELDPKHVEAALAAPECLWRLGRFDDALRAYDRAKDVDPKNPDPFASTIGVRIETRRLEDALRDAEAATKRFPETITFARDVVACLRGLRRDGDASRRAMAFLDATPRWKDSVDLAYLQAAAGRGAEARSTIARLGEVSGIDRRIVLAMVYVALGEKLNAIDVLEKLVDDGWRLRPRGRPLPEFDRLEGNRRFVQVIARAQSGG